MGTYETCPWFIHAVKLASDYVPKMISLLHDYNYLKQLSEARVLLEAPRGTGSIHHTFYGSLKRIIAENISVIIITKSDCY